MVDISSPETFGRSVQRPANASDPYFMQIRDDLADKGFFTATAEELITWARTGSLMWMTFGLACCAIEMMQMSMPRYDAERFGFAPRADMRTALNALAERFDDVAVPGGAISASGGGTTDVNAARTLDR